MSDDGLDLIAPEYCWGLESNADGSFLWTRRQFRITPPEDDAQFMTMKFASLVDGNVLQFKMGEEIKRISLSSGWQAVDIEIRGDSEIQFELAQGYSPEGDERLLGLMLRNLSFHCERERHASICNRQQNSVLNQTEYLSGTEKLSSIPPYLRITTSKSCNIANETPCVYCSWDWAKRMEVGSPDFTPDFLERMGQFVACAVEITDCSYGEPLLEKKFDKILGSLLSGDRVFEFTSNGQGLSEKARALLLDKKLRIYVSVDAATGAGYNRLRDHRFDLIIDNLKALCKEKRKSTNLPEVIVSFIVMRSNLKELSSFFVLAEEIGIDRLMFRSLYREDHLDQKYINHYGWEFDYDEEYLSFEELGDTQEKCLQLAEKFGIKVTIEWDAFVRNHKARGSCEPLCSEPWKAAYILNRGIIPCCYGREPLVTWAGIDTKDNLESELRLALNSPGFIELRKDLAGGRLGQYCQRTRGCPIVKATPKPQLS